MNNHVVGINVLIRAQREVQMVRQIIILVMGVMTIGFPYAIFVFLALFTTPPKYHFRIAYIFVDVSLLFVMIALLKFTESLKMFLLKTINGRANMILPAIA